MKFEVEARKVKSKYTKYDVSALTWVKISNFVILPGVNLLIY